MQHCFGHDEIDHFERRHKSWSEVHIYFSSTRHCVRKRFVCLASKKGKDSCNAIAVAGSIDDLMAPTFPSTCVHNNPGALENGVDR